MASTTILPAPPPLSELERPALFLDFDGTLVEIAHAPHAIEVPAGLSNRIAALDERIGGRLALISGRALDDVENHLGATGFCRAGSHGFDCRGADGSPLGDEPRALPDAAIGALQKFAREAGFDYESKPHGGALHFRSRPEQANEALHFALTVAKTHELTVKRGSGVVELVHAGADKGSAVRAFMRQPAFCGALPIFVGDDLTDEDGMRAATALGGFGVIVGDRTDTVARYRVGTVREVHRWLGL